MRTTSYAETIAHPGEIFIDGAWVAPASGRRTEIISPATEQLYLSVANADAQDVNRAVAAARLAFDRGPWPRMAPSERAAYIRAFAHELARRTDDLAGTWTGEMGSVYSRNLLSVPATARIYDYYADLAGTYPFVEERQSAVATGAYLIREPVGVIAAIVPWNGPFQLASLKLAPALAAGCAVILKASPEAPTMLYIMAEAAAAAGLPPGVINLLCADREASEALVRDPGVDKVSFTGSNAAGRRIAALCGERIARCTLELGGKSPAVVMDDYDVEAFAEALLPSVLALNGQTCASLTRVIATRARQKMLTDALAARMERIKVGDPFDFETQMGPLATKRQLDRVLGYIDTARTEGARLVTGGKRPAHLERGYYIAPTLFADVNNSSTIGREEVFGPVVSVIPVADEEEALEVANDTVFGLNASVFTDDADRAFTAARRIRSGTVSQNAFRFDATIGFGGFKQSGIGREGGVAGLESYLEGKTVLLDRALTGQLA